MSNMFRDCEKCGLQFLVLDAETLCSKCEKKGMIHECCEGARNKIRYFNMWVILVGTIRINITHCPWCGKELEKEESLFGSLQEQRIISVIRRDGNSVLIRLSNSAYIVIDRGHITTKEGTVNIISPIVNIPIEATDAKGKNH